MSKTAIEKYIDEIRIVQSATHTDEQYRAFNICVGIATKYIEHPVSQSREVGGLNVMDIAGNAFDAGMKYVDAMISQHKVDFIDKRTYLNSLSTSLPVPLTDEVETMCVGFAEWVIDEKFIWNNSVRKWSRQPNMYLFLSSSDLFKLYQQHLQSLK